MDFSKVKKALVKYNYVCVRLDSNFDIISQLRTEKKVCILGEDIDCFSFLQELKKNFKKYSLIYFHDFQRGNIFSKQIISEWKKIFDQGGIKLPYLLIGTYSFYYYDSGLIFDNNRYFNFSKGEPKIRYSPINYIDPSDVDIKLYNNLSSIIAEDLKKENGYRALVIVPNYESQNYLHQLLNDKIEDGNVIKFDQDDIPDSLFFSESKASKYSKNFIFISLDLTHKPIFFTEIDIVYDSGEKDQVYETRTGFNKVRTAKINHQEMKTRMMTYAPEHYVIMFPKTSILNLDKYYTPDVNDDVDILKLVSIKIYPDKIPKSLYTYGTLKNGGSKTKGKPVITNKGEFCMNISIPIKYSSFLYECCLDGKMSLKQAVIILIAIFINIDLYDNSTPIRGIYLSICCELGTGIIESPTPIISSIDELVESLKVDKNIIDPFKELDLIIPKIKKHFKSNILKLENGRYRDSKGNFYTLTKDDKLFHKTILPISIWRNQKGDRFVDHYFPL